MEAMPPFPVVSGQRQLAAIMFTDAVGYSAQMHDQELATLNRLERDAGLMRRIAGDRGGTVLKSTGDGLLIQFSSAVEAVAAGLEIQREFQTRTETGVSTSTLRHRIGVHLGDVFVSQGDIMGDGVNIAARLVAEALPGGIVISEMVHTLVKNKLPLHVQPLGRRRLKNIKEPVLLFRVLLDAPAQPVVPASATATPAADQPPPARAGRRPQKIAAVLAILLGVAGGGRYLLQQQLAHEEELTQSQSAGAALGALLKKSEPAAANPPVAAPPATGPDFAMLTTAEAATMHPTPETLPLIRAAEGEVAALQAWLVRELGRYTRDRPLTITGLGNGAPQNLTLFTDTDHFLYFAEGGAFRRRSWVELKPPVQAAIIVGVLRRTSPPAATGLWRGAEAFAYLHGLPEMAAASPRP